MILHHRTHHQSQEETHEDESDGGHDPRGALAAHRLPRSNTNRCSRQPEERLSAGDRQNRRQTCRSGVSGKIGEAQGRRQHDSGGGRGKTPPDPHPDGRDERRQQHGDEDESKQGERYCETTWIAKWMATSAPMKAGMNSIPKSLRWIVKGVAS